MERAAVYIDGFNLYFGLCERGWRRYLWLDLAAMARKLITPDQTLVATKYFTARVRGDPEKVHRQSTYLQALEARGGLSIHYGRYQEKSMQCRSCLTKWTQYEEKMSDVRLAVELLKDTYANNYDTAVIVSADADLQPPIEIVKADFPGKKVVIVFPPSRDSFHLRAIAPGFFRIGRGLLSKSQLPRSVRKPDGYLLHRPAEWQ